MSDFSAAVTRAIKVLVVDDSALIRAALSRMINDDPGLELFGLAVDPFDAVEKMQGNMPDVILLDLELPRMDGMTFLRKLMAQSPIPVVVCSAHTRGRNEAGLRALELGASDVLAKPDMSDSAKWAEASIRIGDALRAAVQSGRSRPRPAGRRLAIAPRGSEPKTPQKPQVNVPNPLLNAPGEKLSADVILPARPAAPVRALAPIVAVGASTGGTDALRRMISALPITAPPMVIVQHMPEHFTGAFADRLNTVSAVEVSEAKDGQSLRRGQVLVAPGNRHMLLKRSGSAYSVSLVDGPYVCRHRPSVDVLFRSVAQEAAQNALGIVLTGMGDDGAAGMGEMRQAGAHTIAQDEATSVVYGMPREAMRRGAAMRELPIGAMADVVAAWRGPRA